MDVNEKHEQVAFGRMTMQLFGVLNSVVSSCLDSPNTTVAEK